LWVYIYIERERERETTKLRNFWFPHIKCGELSQMMNITTFFKINQFYYFISWLPDFIFLYRTIILPVILYGCDTWSLTLREEHKYRFYSNYLKLCFNGNFI
jgi:hypothetical protein